MKVQLILLGETDLAMARTVLEHLPPPWSDGGVVRSSLALTGFIDRSRQQLDASLLLEATEMRGATGALENEAVRVAITTLDLFLPVLAYVSGLAPLGGGRAVVSTARLDPGPAVGRQRGAVLRRRLLIEVVHEAGHALGLVHCPVPGCVMHQSLSAEAMDLKDAEACPTCLGSLKTLETARARADPGDSAGS